MEVNALGKHYDINRIVWNAKLLRDPQIYECFVYGKRETVLNPSPF